MRSFVFVQEQINTDSTPLQKWNSERPQWPSIVHLRYGSARSPVGTTMDIRVNGKRLHSST